MSFSRDDLVAYAAQPQIQVENHDPFNPTSAKVEPKVEAEADVNAAIDASITGSDVTENNDGSTTETPAESVAADPANPEGAKDPELEDPADGRNRSRAQERIEELVAERNALREYGKYLLKQVEGVRSPEKAESQPVSTVATSEEQAPTLEDAEFDPVKLSQMQNTWIKKQVDKGIQDAVRGLESRQSEVATRQAFEARTAEFRKTVKDFEVVISNPALPQLAPDAAKVLVKSVLGPAVLYHLGKNPDLAARIARQEPAEQAAALGRIEEQLSRVTQKEPSVDTKLPAKVASVTKAPPPHKPITGGANSGNDPNRPMGMDEWVANERNRKLQERTERQKIRKAYR